MKTKINFPWVTILKEYFDYLSNNDDKCYICNISSIFAKLWVNKSYRLEIKEEMISFLKKFEAKYKLFRVDLDDRACCLVYCSIDDFESYEEKHRAEKNMKKHFLEYMVEKSKPKTKYSYFRHSQPYCFGNFGGPSYLIRRENKTGEYKVINYSRKMIADEDKERAEYNIEQGNWVAANQEEINKIKRLYRETKYLYYRHKDSIHFGNPKSNKKYIVRHERKTNEFYTMHYDAALVKENKILRKDRDYEAIYLDGIEKGIWVPARKQEIKLAIKFNK